MLLVSEEMMYFAPRKQTKLFEMWSKKFTSCVCVCVYLVFPTLWRTNVPTSKPVHSDLMGTFSWSPWGNKLMNHEEWSVLKSEIAESFVWGVALGQWFSTRGPHAARHKSKCGPPCWMLQSMCWTQLKNNFQFHFIHFSFYITLKMY